jgi:hypothetical protein
MEFFNEDELKKKIDEYYNQGIKTLYGFIEIEEYISIRVIFIIAHLTSVWFGEQFFSNFGYLLFTEIYLVGFIQVFGAVIFLGLSITLNKYMPYHQLLVLSSSILFLIGGYRILVYFPKIDVLYYMFVCAFITVISYLGIWALKHMFPKLKINKKID